jgi:hypothetical protein
VPTRRTALQAGAFAAATLGVPQPTLAAAVESGSQQKRFEALVVAAGSSLSSTSKLLETVSALTLDSRSSNFVFAAPSLCKAPKAPAFVSVRLWRPVLSGTSGLSSEGIVNAFEARFSKLAQKERGEGFKLYYGAVARANGEDYALFANIFETQAQAELINTQELAINKKKLLRANLQLILPVFSCDAQLPAALGGCADA